MKNYRIRITDSYGFQRIVTVKAYSVIDALDSLDTDEGEIVAECTEVSP